MQLGDKRGGVGSNGAVGVVHSNDHERGAALARFQNKLERGFEVLLGLGAQATVESQNLQLGRAFVFQEKGAIRL
jgi:hypothetical protein